MTAPSPADHGPARPWESCVVPLVVFLAAGLLEPTPSGGGLAGMLGIPYAAYPFIYAARLAANPATALQHSRGLFGSSARPILQTLDRVA